MRKREAFHLVKRLASPVSPEAFYRAFAGPNASLFILDGGGAAANRRLDRCSFMGADPVATFRAERRRSEAHDRGPIVRNGEGHAAARVVVESAEGRSVEEDIDPFDALRRFLAQHAPSRVALDDDFSFPLRAGLVGYVGYEAGQFLEALPCLARPHSGMPDIALALHRWVVATRWETAECWLSVLGQGSTEVGARAEAEAIRSDILRRLASTSVPSRRAERPRPVSRRTDVHPRPRLSRSEYIDRVMLAKEHIAAGDAFEICLTNALRAPLAQSDAWALFDELRRTNPAPFAALLDLPEGAVVSSSPERFLSLDDCGTAESRPIKGTRPRGASAAEDQKLADDLRSSEKDRAENAMIVDLVRNDLGKVCRFGTVDVPELYAVEPYATVHQLVSTVRGKLAPGKDAIDLLCACFPPGSMTGAPKIEAMSILEGLEPVERGVYAGALGWMDVGGAMDLSVVIRTAVIREGVATFSVGGAIVADSDPASEHEETEDKARALVRALGALATAAETAPGPVDRAPMRVAEESP